MRTPLPLAFVLAVVACDSKPKAAAEPTPTAVPAAVTSGAPPSTTPAALASAPAPSAAVPPSASAAAAPVAAGPCPPNAKRYDTPKFCVVLPEKTLDITYEEYDASGDVEVEAPGGTLRFHWEPTKAMSRAALKKEMERADDGWKLVSSGEIPGGAWSEIEKAAGDEAGTSSGEHVVRSVTATKKLDILCHYSVKAEHVEQARATCQSVRTY